MPAKDESKQKEDLQKGCVGCLTLVVILGDFIGCSALFFSGKTPEKQVNVKEINPAASLNIDDSKQMISDEQVGRTMAKVLCGDKTSEEAVNYFNQMGVPVEKMKIYKHSRKSTGDTSKRRDPVTANPCLPLGTLEARPASHDDR